MPERRKPSSDAWRKAEKIGPDPQVNRVSLAGVPKPASALWQILASVKPGMPPEIQELLKYLPLAPVK